MRDIFKKKWISKVLFSLPLLILLFAGLYFLLIKLKPELFKDTYGVPIIKADQCLDRGGCWDYVDDVCRKEEPSAQELCNRKK